MLPAVMTFALDPRLAADTLAVGDLALSRALLMNDSRYPWLILVPRREALYQGSQLMTRHARPCAGHPRRHAAASPDEMPRFISFLLMGGSSFTDLLQLAASCGS